MKPEEFHGYYEQVLVQWLIFPAAFGLLAFYFGMRRQVEKQNACMFGVGIGLLVMFIRFVLLAIYEDSIRRQYGLPRL